MSNNLITGNAKWLKNSYGSNWQPLVPVNNKSHFNLLFNIATYVQETISSGVQADFTNLAETLVPYLKVRYTSTF